MLSAPSFSADYQKGVDAYRRGNFQAALKEWGSLGEAGHPQALVSLGLMHEAGRGVEQNLTEAVRFYRLAADQGYAEGQTSLGVMYEYGAGVDQSVTEAVRWYRLAAEQGHARGQKNLGTMYEFGKGVQRSLTEAVSWYRLAAEQGYAEGQTSFGVMYENGAGIEQNFTEAVRWYRLAAQQGHARGQKNLGLMYESGRGVAQSLTEAVRWYRLAAEQGYAKAQKNLGTMYEFGRGVEQNLTEAVRWYRSAAEQGLASGQKNLGTMYEFGRGVEQNLTEAVRWYRLAAEQGHAEGQTSLGVMYDNGDGVEQNRTEAVRWYRLAAEQGHARGQKNLGTMYEFGNGVQRSLTEAVRWYRLAAEQGYAEGQTNLGVMYVNGAGVDQSSREAARWFQLAAEQGHARAQNYLGLMYESGKGVAESLSEAVKWYRLAANQGNESAINRLKELDSGWAPQKGGRDSPKPANQSIETDKELEELRERIALLEAQSKQTMQAIASDNTPPIIRITSLNIKGLRASISAEVTDNLSVGEVTLNGSLPQQINGSTYYWETFIPSEGLSVLIEAVDQNGLMSRKSTRIEREKTTETVTRLAAVNPLVGPKQKPSRDRAALVIGLEQYAEAPPADYASRDAQMFADYAREKLGIAPGNIKLLTDTEATRSGLLRALKVWLPQAVRPNKTDLYIFYAGHGMASDDGESAYIVPYGADTFLLEDTAISRERLYEEIGAAKPRTATFFFDNCYAGTTRSEERLLAQRPLSIKVQESSVPDNYIVFTAGESNQTAGVLDEVKHGRFSYFVFKGLEGEADANQDGKISAGELHAYVRESVGRFSAGAQTPTMLGDAARWVLR